ncbi:hypothetical protein Syun_002794 [Stephania yunnanensis]|uniref:F-box domain-containing protein n=1 Tax=Stephania yunnanensis TaxID=152371 RepID=A0AAP0LKC2_9MAGN
MEEGLPDEIWRRIFEIGIEKSRLSYKDVCCVSITSRRLKRLSNEDTLWTHLLNLDFSIPIDDDDDIVIPASKTLYKTMFDKDRERKIAAHRRAVLRAESDVGVCLRNLKQLQRQLADERDKARAAECLSGFECLAATNHTGSSSKTASSGAMCFTYSLQNLCARDGS